MDFILKEYKATRHKKTVHVIVIDYLLMKLNGKNLRYYHWTLTNKAMCEFLTFNIKKGTKSKIFFRQLLGNKATFCQLLVTFIGNFFGIHRQLVAKPIPGTKQ